MPLALEAGLDPVLKLAEQCGLGHEWQVLVAEVPTSYGELAGFLSEDGRFFAAQRSRQDPQAVFFGLPLAPFESLALRPCPGRPESAGFGYEGSGTVSFHAESNRIGVISNGKFSLKVLLADDAAAQSGRPSMRASGPIIGFKIGDGPWRGGAFVDSRRIVVAQRGEMLERGPIRSVYRYRVEFEGEGFYQAIVTVDANACFARFDEAFHAGCGDQVVWDFCGADLPRELYALDSSAGYRTRALAYHYDVRLARVAAWTQQSQHLDYVDGFALKFQQYDDVVGFVTLEGGEWRGDKLNHLEAWVRRWLPGDPTSRRDLPAAAKADSYPGPERIAARGGVVCEEHFNVEAWIGQGRRSFALILTTRQAITPEGSLDEVPLGHFEQTPDRARYQRQQSLLRKIHTQFGVMPLQKMAGWDFSWAQEPVRPEGGDSFCFPNEVLDAHFDCAQGDPLDAAKEMLAYLEARVYGFWEGSGIAYTNPVVSRRVAPEMFRYEWLARQGVLTDAERVLARAHFAFLAYLFSSENYYTGDAAMLPADSPDSTEPSLAGMANQNFYTDVINVFGVGAQIFFLHPMAESWRRRFRQQWHCQLGFHMFPESGLWEESHTYYEHVMHTVLPTFLRRRADGVDDEFANPEMQKLVGAALKQVTPRDFFLNARRCLIAFGDHGPGPNPRLYKGLSEAFVDAAPELSRHLAWVAREMGGEVSSSVDAVQPPWVSETVQGLGVMFRGTDSAGAESLFALRSGAAWGHHHNDDGSFQFFAKGRSLIVDSAFGNSQSAGRKVQATGHSRWSLRDLDPVNYYWRFNRGWVTNSSIGGRFPYASIYSPVYMVRGGLAHTEMLGSPVGPVLHWRTVVQLAITTYLIVDVSRCEVPQVVRFHLAGADAFQQGERVILDFEQSRLQVIPILSQAEPALTVHRAQGDKVPGEFVTTEACFDIGLASFAAFLVHVGAADEVVALDSSADTCVVCLDDCKVEIARLPEHRLRLTDRNGGKTLTLDLRYDAFN